MRDARIANATQIVLTVALIVAMAGCDPDETNPAPRCGDGGQCPPGAHCYRTYCVPDEPPPDEGDAAPDGGAQAPLFCPATLCGTACVDLATDEANCGACGRVCGVDEVCSNRVCCNPADEIGCGGTCVHHLDDENNCGGCGIRCAAEHQCVEAVCVQSD